MSDTIETEKCIINKEDGKNFELEMGCLKDSMSKIKFYSREKRKRIKYLKNLGKYFVFLLISFTLIVSTAVMFSKFWVIPRNYHQIQVEKETNNYYVRSSLFAFYRLNPELIKDINIIELKKEPSKIDFFEFTNGVLGQSGGYYNQLGNKIVLFKNFDSYSIYHEFAHHLWMNILTEEEKQEWKEIHRDAKKRMLPAIACRGDNVSCTKEAEERQKNQPLFVSEYAITKYTEDFSETFAYYIEREWCLGYINSPREGFCKEDLCLLGKEATYGCFLEYANMEETKVNYFLNLDRKYNFLGG